MAPGDAREVNNRKKVCAEKGDQILRKSDAAQGVVRETLKLFGINSFDEGCTEWKVAGVVVFDGYITANPLHQRFPFVLLDVFVLAIEQFDNLAKLHNWLSGTDWLPEEGNHWSPAEITTKYGNQGLRWSTMWFPHEKRYSKGHLAQSLDRALSSS